MSALHAAVQKAVLLRRGGAVKRFHTAPIVGEVTVGHHSFGALSLLLLLNPNPTVTLIRAVAWHDMAEQHVGDAPAPGLWADSNYSAAYVVAENRFLEGKFGLYISQLSNEEQYWLVGVDKLECLFFAAEQIQLGNRAGYRFARNLEKWFAINRELLPLPILEFYDELVSKGFDQIMEDGVWE